AGRLLPGGRRRRRGGRRADRRTAARLARIAAAGVLARARAPAGRCLAGHLAPADAAAGRAVDERPAARHVPVASAGGGRGARDDRAHAGAVRVAFAYRPVRDARDAGDVLPVVAGAGAVTLVVDCRTDRGYLILIRRPADGLVRLSVAVAALVAVVAVI